MYLLLAPQLSSSHRVGGGGPDVDLFSVALPRVAGPTPDRIGDVSRHRTPGFLRGCTVYAVLIYPASSSAVFIPSRGRRGKHLLLGMWASILILHASALGNISHDSHLYTEKIKE